jgi:hypothetical protein
MLAIPLLKAGGSHRRALDWDLRRDDFPMAKTAATGHDHFIEAMKPSGDISPHA